MKWKAIVCGCALALGVSAVPTSAAPIFGEINFTGSARVSAVLIDWQPFGGPTVTPPPHNGEGDIRMVEPGSGYFSNIWQPTSGLNSAHIVDIVTGGPAVIPNFLHNFITPDPTYDDLSFTLNGLSSFLVPVCTGAEAVGASCVAFPGSPFLLTRTQTGTSVEFDVFGFWTDPTEGPDSSNNTADIIFTSNISGVTPFDITTTIAGGGSVTGSFSAQGTAVPFQAPEPFTLTLFGIGLTAMAYRLRHRRGR